MLAFGIVFFIWLLVITELRSRAAEVRAVTLFKWGSDVAIIEGDPKDEEKASVSTTTAKCRGASEAVEKVLAEQPKMADMFSWRHLDYTIPIPGGERRRLLNDVSGFVVLFLYMYHSLLSLVNKNDFCVY